MLNLRNNLCRHLEFGGLVRGLNTYKQYLNQYGDNIIPQEITVDVFSDDNNTCGEKKEFGFTVEYDGCMCFHASKR